MKPILHPAPERICLPNNDHSWQQDTRPRSQAHGWDEWDEWDEYQREAMIETHPNMLP